MLSTREKLQKQNLIRWNSRIGPCKTRKEIIMENHFLELTLRSYLPLNLRGFHSNHNSNLVSTFSELCDPEQIIAPHCLRCVIFRQKRLGPLHITACRSIMALDAKMGAECHRPMGCHYVGPRVLSTLLYKKHPPS